MNIFEKATKNKLRFDSVRGNLSVEELWDMRLTSRDDFNLDTIAKKINKELKEQEEESFVERNSNPQKDILELSLEIIKHIINNKISSKEAAEKRAVTMAKKEQIKEILAKKEMSSLENMSEEKLKALLNE